MWVLLPSQNFYSQGYGKYISKKKEKIMKEKKEQNGKWEMNL